MVQDSYKRQMIFPLSTFWFHSSPRTQPKKSSTMIKILIVLSVAVACIVCEPPSSYLPPGSNNYLPPTNGNNYLGTSTDIINPFNNFEAQNTNDHFNPEVNYAYGAPLQNDGYLSGEYGAPKPAYGPPKPSYGPPEETAPAKYEFEWEVNDPESGNEYGQKEARDGDKVVGQYMVLLPDGRRQIVNYEADEDGYKPTITYEEPKVNGGYPKVKPNGGYQY